MTFGKKMSFKEGYICTKDGCDWQKTGESLSHLLPKGVERLETAAEKHPLWEASCPECGGKVKQRLTISRDGREP